MQDETALATHLELKVQHHIGTLKLDVAFQASALWTVLFGPSGSGKSTILRILAGLEKPTRGYVRLGAKTVCDRECGVWIPPHRRPMRWSGQRAMLFPRQTVRTSLSAGIGFQSQEASGLIDRALDHFHLRPLEHVLPEELSGGQRQRVAVIRAAIGARGRTLLLDEPFSGLDANIRDELIHGLRTWLPDTPIVSVTHDVGEAFLLQAEVIRVANGQIVAQGSAAQVLAEERTRLTRFLNQP